MSVWVLWRSVMRIGYPEMLPMYKSKPDFFDSKEEGQMSIPTIIAQYVANLKNNRDVIEIKAITEEHVGYIIKDATHPSGKRDVYANWLLCPAGFNPNESH